MKGKEFPFSVIEKLGFYVYSLTDPKGEIFYVGKGNGNRIFAHINAAIKNPKASDKLQKIRKIQKAGEKLKLEILRHGLTEKEAFEVESAIIDLVGKKSLTNKVAGHSSDRHGRMSVPEIIALYHAEPITIKVSAIMVIANRLYERNISAERLYEITRGNWVMGERRNKVKYALTIYRGIVREVLKINRWIPTTARNPQSKKQTRWRFEGEIAPELQHLIGGSVEPYLKQGAQNPVLCLNC